MLRDKGFGKHGTLDDVLPRPKGARTLQNANEEMRHLLQTKGTATCANCGHTSTISRVPIARHMSYALVLLYRRYHINPDPVHMQDLLQSTPDAPRSIKGGGDASKLRFWEFIQKMREGFYTITERGRSFVEGECTVPSHVHLYKGVVVDWEDAEIDILQSLDCSKTELKRFIDTGKLVRKAA